MNNTILVMLIAIVVVGLLIFAIIVLTRRGGGSLDQDYYRSKWLAIETMVGTSAEANHLAIINADKLLDGALKARGLPGSTMSDRLKGAKKMLSSINAVWTVHKLRNRIVHEDITVGEKHTRQALAVYKKALRDVGAL